MAPDFCISLPQIYDLCLLPLRRTSSIYFTVLTVPSTLPRFLRRHESGAIGQNVLIKPGRRGLPSRQFRNGRRSPGDWR